MIKLFIKYILFIRSATKDNMNKNCLPNNRLNRYHYKINHSSITNPVNSQQNDDHHIQSRKQSRSKIKKESTQSSFGNTTDHFIEDIRMPLEDYKGNTNKKSQNLTHNPKKQVKTLKNKNQELQGQIIQQAKEIEQLRYALSSIKDTVQRNAKNLKETQDLKETNKSLQAKYQSQAKEMSILQNQIQSLRGLLQNSQIILSIDSSQIEQSKISRRAQYAQQYQNIIQRNTKIYVCQQCQKQKEFNSKLQQQYVDQLRRLEQQRLILKEKQAALKILQQENIKKNQSIDYLRGEIQNFEKNSKNLLSVIYSLQGLYARDGKNLRRNSQTPQLKSYPKQTMTNFSNFRY